MWTFNGVGPMVQWPQGRVLDAAPPGAAVPLLRQLGVPRVLVGAGGPLGAQLRGAGFHPVGDGPLQVLVANPPAPRYLLARHARAAPVDEILPLARSGRALDDDAVLIETSPAGQVWDGDPAGRLEVGTHAPAVARLRVSVDRPTWLIAREPYYANWTAAIDGGATAIVPAGGFFLGVLIPAGAHEVALEYREPRLAPGLAIAALVTLVAAAMVARDRSSRAG